jgi:hypothetical protein
MRTELSPFGAEVATVNRGGYEAKTAVVLMLDFGEGLINRVAAISVAVWSCRYSEFCRVAASLLVLAALLQLDVDDTV